jgi:hypothetical protein
LLAALRRRLTMTATTRTPAQRLAALRRTEKFKACITAKVDPDLAVKALDPELHAALHPVEADPLTAQVAALVAANFTEAEARRLLGGTATEVTPAEAAVAVKDEAEALVAAKGLAFTKGRVYVTGSILEAAARVLKGKKPEIVASSGVGRTSAVLVFCLPSGDAAIQNLHKPV